MQCDYFDAGRCRSCTLMGTPYADQLAAKEHRAASALASSPPSGGSTPSRSPDSHYRNKAKLVVAGRTRGTRPWASSTSAGRGVDLRRCGLYEPGLAATFDPLHRFVSDLGIEPYDVPGAARRAQVPHRHALPRR